jgi:hypothetical protein
MEPTAPTPVFPTNGERPVSLALIGFILLSLFAHAATFFVFQVVYPQHVTLPPRAPQVMLLTPATPEQDALLRWVDAEDPALVAATAGSEPPGLMKLDYHPSFQTLRTPPRLPPEEGERAEQAPSSIALSFTHFPGGTPPRSVPRSSVETVVRLSGALSERRLTKSGPLTVKASAPLQPARFLVAIDDRGELRYTFLQTTSGDAKADAAAAVYLSAASYSPGTDALAWGVATIVWGDEAYSQP